MRVMSHFSYVAYTHNVISNFSYLKQSLYLDILQAQECRILLDFHYLCVVYDHRFFFFSNSPLSNLC